MKILGIETTGRSGSIAIIEEQTVLAEKELSATGRRHARTLVPEIGSLIEEQNLQLREFDGVAVSIGPGSFTGLRVGVVCAKTLSYSLQKKLAAIDTFQAIAANLCNKEETIWVIDDALRGDVYAGQYISDQSKVQVIQMPVLISLEELKEKIEPHEILTGPGVTKLEDDLTELNLAEKEFRLPTAAQIALLGERKFQVNQSDDQWTIEPHYIRRSAAEEKADV